MRQSLCISTPSPVSPPRPTSSTAVQEGPSPLRSGAALKLRKISLADESNSAEIVLRQAKVQPKASKTILSNAVPGATVNAQDQDLSAFLLDDDDEANYLNHPIIRGLSAKINEELRKLLAKRKDKPQNE